METYQFEQRVEVNNGYDLDVRIWDRSQLMILTTGRARSSSNMHKSCAAARQNFLWHLVPFECRDSYYCVVWYLCTFSIRCMFKPNFQTKPIQYSIQLKNGLPSTLQYHLKHNLTTGHSFLCTLITTVAGQHNGILHWRPRLYGESYMMLGSS
jgi:hypothetical protein